MRAPKPLATRASACRAPSAARSSSTSCAAAASGSAGGAAASSLHRFATSLSFGLGLRPHSCSMSSARAPAARRCARGAALSTVRRRPRMSGLSFGGSERRHVSASAAAAPSPSCSASCATWRRATAAERTSRWSRQLRRATAVARAGSDASHTSKVGPQSAAAACASTIEPAPPGHVASSASRAAPAPTKRASSRSAHDCSSARGAASSTLAAAIASASVKSAVSFSPVASRSVCSVSNAPACTSVRAQPANTHAPSCFPVVKGPLSSPQRHSSQRAQALEPACASAASAAAARSCRPSVTRASASWV
eukprot:717023-Prymnesium_polylepis.2